MSCRVRVATEDDLDIVVALNDEVQRRHARDYPEEFRYPLDRTEVRRFFMGRLAAEHPTVLLAVIGQRPAGYLLYEIEPQRPGPFRNAARRALLSQICVTAAQRRQGVGRRLVAALDEAAEEAGCSEILLDCWAGNAEAKAFFDALGFATARIWMRRAVGAG